MCVSKRVTCTTVGSLFFSAPVTPPLPQGMVAGNEGQAVSLPSSAPAGSGGFVAVSEMSGQAKRGKIQAKDPGFSPHSVGAMGLNPHTPRPPHL